MNQVRSNQVIQEFTPAVQTNELANKYPDTFEPLASKLNEVYLWHGTSVRVALSIAQEDFRLDTAGQNVGTMYGRGVYLTENSTKADEYAKDDPGGFYDGIFAMLLCRVSLGKYFYTTERNEDAIQFYQSGEYDSTCGDRAKSVGTFREFVVYDADQLYPEYVILYQRTHKGDATDAWIGDTSEALPYQLECPVYWFCSHVDHEKTDINNKYGVTPGAKALLQRLVDVSCPKSGPKMYVDAAWRIENSVRWRQYNRTKAKLHDKLKANGDTRFRPVDALELNHRGSGIRLANWAEGDPITTSNVDVDLNEALLWHMTPAEVAETNAHELRLTSGSLGYGCCFVNGLEGAAACVILCRVLCGEAFQNRLSEDPESVGKAKTAGNDAVLVAGSTTTVAVWDMDQVYPEFVLRLTSKPGQKTAQNHQLQQQKQQQPSSRPPQSSSTSTAQNNRTMVVEIPAGAQPGSRIQAKTPDGKTVEAVIPAGMRPGQQLTFAY